MRRNLLVFKRAPLVSDYRAKRHLQLAFEEILPHYDTPRPSLPIELSWKRCKMDTESDSIGMQMRAYL